MSGTCRVSRRKGLRVGEGEEIEAKEDQEDIEGL